MNIRLWLMALSSLLVLSAYAPAAEEHPASAPAAHPTDPATVLPEVQEFRLIHADSMTLTRRKDKPQVFQGAVDIVMLDKAGSETEIQAEKITIHYEQDLRRINRMEAEGRVKIIRAGTVATTELAVYRGEKDMIELLIDPHVKDSRGELTANKISIFMKTDEVVAAGNVRGLLYPKSFEKTSK
jgi:lipopolysaccharide export system protein LptA